MISQQSLEAISNPPEADWFKIATGPHFHAKPDDAPILNIRGTPFEIASSMVIAVVINMFRLLYF
jgi:hypothetical protein